MSRPDHQDCMYLLNSIDNNAIVIRAKISESSHSSPSKSDCFHVGSWRME